ncbi:uncharacterized protein LOC141901152 [Tubulanus polymorphus]|uniref:uncharacterized protein LOC141901152 n=1 Tax=Tubulanus polymorphus TaxID=672921 RepID=UPI003DA592D3
MTEVEPITDLKSRNNTNSRDTLEWLAGHYAGTKKCVDKTKDALKEVPPLTNTDGEPQLLLDRFRCWYEIVKNNDVNAYDQLKRDISKDQFDNLLNGIFFEHEKKKIDDQPGDFKRPLLLACVFSAKDVVERMIQDGANVLARGHCNMNCIHALIITAGHCPSQEDIMIDIYRFLFAKITHAERIELLKGEDINKFRPLELAAKLQTFGLFQLIIETEELYIVDRGERGLYKTLTYDLTEYESFQSYKREIRSPLRMLVYTKIDNLDKFLKYKMNKNALLNKWMKFKIIRNVPFLVIWFLIRIAFLICLILVEPRVLNLMPQLEFCRGLNTSQVSGTGAKYTDCSNVHGDSFTVQFNISMAGILFVCGLFLFFDVVEIIVKVFDRDRRLAYAGLGIPFVGGYLSFTYFYRLVQLALNVICLLTAIAAYTNLNNLYFLRFMKALYIPLIFLSLMYVVEMVPFIGQFAMVLQRMIAIMGYFILISVLVKLVFQVGYFQQVFGDDSSFNTTTNGLYTMFILENGVTDIGTTVMVPDGLAYVAYFYMSAILLVNYLIAAMSVEANITNDVRETVQWLRRLDAAILCEERFGRILWKIIYKCKKVAPRIRLHVTDTMYD